MARAISLMAADAPAAPACDTLLLSHDERRAPRGAYKGLRGTLVEIALPAATRLRNDDRLTLEDGGVVEIVARPEPLIEIRAQETATLARAAWLLGDHHIPVEIHARRLRILRAVPAEELLRSLDVTLRMIDAPFEPEGGAYDHASQPGA